MKDITLSAEESLIEAARERARRENTTLDALFARWLRQYVERNSHPALAMQTIRELQERYGFDGQRYTRDEMHGR